MVDYLSRRLNRDVMKEVTTFLYTVEVRKSLHDRNPPFYGIRVNVKGDLPAFRYTALPHDFVEGITNYYAEDPTTGLVSFFYTKADEYFERDPEVRAEDRLYLFVPCDGDENITITMIDGSTEVVHMPWKSGANGSNEFFPHAIDVVVAPWPITGIRVDTASDLLKSKGLVLRRDPDYREFYDVESL